ncbi:hypothetical protein HDV02_004329 [Globomyces sp. JEL0801]|nr:hypothetical protein HDV02_004329 [Globomyces sp. JEL0801]
MVDVTFAIAFIPIKIRSLTKFTFNSHGKVIAHEDVWSIRDIIQSIPLMGYLYQFGVGMNGTVSSHVINRVGWLFEKKVNKIQ